LKKNLAGTVFAAILRDARLWRAPQDEVLFRGEILDPHGEERRSRRVSNHEAEYVSQATKEPYPIALPQAGRGGRRIRELSQIDSTSPLIQNAP
jgi:hypothetical protein